MLMNDGNTFQEAAQSLDTHILLGRRSFGEVPSVYIIGLLLTITPLVSRDQNAMYISSREYIRSAVNATLVIMKLDMLVLEMRQSELRDYIRVTM